jgi:outer membrane receptor protein involved in Fe transport
MTKEFLNDIGALNVAQAMEYGLNAGNDIGGGSADGVTGNNLIGRDYNLQIRNYRNATQTRNYFDTLISGDTFNVERIDISRGPNSLLFGIGSVGGIVNVTPKAAQIGLKKDEVLVRTGSYSRNRAALDVNRTLIDGKLAARINLMYQEADGYHDFESDDQKRGALALTWTPTRSTSIRVDFEKGKLHQNKVRPWLPFDGITNWEVWGSHFIPFGTPESPWLAGDNNYSQQQTSAGSGAPNNNLPAVPALPFWGGEFRSAGNLVAPNGRASFMDGPLAGKVLYLGVRAEGPRY